MGDEDKTFVSFIMEKITAHTSPDKMLEELVVFLDEDAEGFVLKLYRLVIFETEKQKLMQ